MKRLMLAAALAFVLGGAAVRATYSLPAPWMGQMSMRSGTWSAGWTHVKPIVHDGIMDVFVYNTNNGTWAIVRMTEAGSTNCDPNDLPNCHP